MLHFNDNLANFVGSFMLLAKLFILSFREDYTATYYMKNLV